jgi:hypothetical protein
VRNRSYTLHVGFARLTPHRNGTLGTRDVRLSVEDGRYVARTTLGRSNGRARGMEVYYDGDAHYVADWTGQTTDYTRISEGDPDATQVPNPFLLGNLPAGSERRFL